MHGTTSWQIDQRVRVGLHALVVLSVVGLALVGQVPEEAAGWLLRPVVSGAAVGRRRASWDWGPQASHLAALGRYLLVSWPPVVLRSLALWGVWAWSGCWGPSWLRLLPWVLS
jgi:hypothetical protein